ncbi:MAG: hypothetical protein WAQ99_07035 [Pyrinomonadaceae bacterium]
MTKRLQLALLFLISSALFSVSYGSNPSATAGGTDPHSRLSLDPVAKLRTLTRPKAALPHPGPLPSGEGENTRGEEPSGTDSHPSAAAGVTDADFAAHIEQLKKKLPSNDFTIVVQKPFVVIGDEPADAVKEHSIRTVKWAVDKLKQEYFSKDPNEIVDIWLFKNKASYERNAQLLFGGNRPTTPYGYYSKIHKALVMDISTGGGTLVHEIVHPFIEANFPNCPPWFNEGLGSLYEQSGEVRGRIHGFTNWRLHRLQADIKAGRVPPFRKLMGMSVPEFYNFESGLHYAQSRYLLYYLQQKGLLKKFYREFFANQRTDPTGYQTLARVLGTRNLGIFKFKWELWVMDLTQGHESSEQWAVCGGL